MEVPDERLVYIAFLSFDVHVLESEVGEFILVGTFDVKERVALQGDVDTAWDALVTAMENLRLKANKDALEDLLDEAAGLDLSRYTEESAAAFRTALASAQAVLADETLSEDDQQKVDDAVAALKEAKDGLVAKTDDSGNGNTNSGNSVNKAAKTGDAAPVMGLMMLVIVSGAAVLAVSRKRTR